MDLLIRMDQTEPPVGTVAPRRGAAWTLPFEGWLGLLRVLTDAIAANDDRVGLDTLRACHRPAHDA